MTEQFTEILDLTLKQGRNVFMSGPGGCGKTYTIKELIEYFKKNSIPYAATALTAVAAYNFGGRTLHSFVFSGYGQGDLKDILRRINRHKRAAINKIKVLIIDEVSMLGAQLMENVNGVLQNVRRSTLPFGGVTLIVSGDFLQLPPVKDGYAFKCPSWKALRFVKVTFSTPYRFEDPAYFAMLQRIRIAQPSENDYKRLEYRRMDIYDILPDNSLIKPTVIYSLRDDVQNENTSELAKIEKPSFTFTAIDSLMYERGDDLIPLNQITQQELHKITEAKTSMKIIDHKPVFDMMIDSTVVIKETAQAMLIYNLDTETGRVNGSRCVIASINDAGVYATFIDGQTIIVPRVTITRKLEGNLVLCRSQIPLVLGYAITIHKCQGTSLDCAVVDLGPSVFDNSQAYVALSRVRKLSGLFLTNFVRKSIRADKDALAFELGTSGP